MKKCTHGRIERNCYFCFTGADYEFITGNGDVDYPLINYMEQMGGRINELETRIIELERQLNSLFC